MQKQKKSHQHLEDVATRHNPKTIVSWLAKEYPHHEKSKLWFIIAGTIVGSLVIYGLFTDGWTFSMALIVACGAYYVSHRNPPEIVTMSITSHGIKIGKHMLEYPTIKYFWVVYNPPHIQRLYLRFNHRISPDITLDIDDADVTEIRRELKKHIVENESIHEPFIESIIRLFKL